MLIEKLLIAGCQPFYNLTIGLFTSKSNDNHIGNIDDLSIYAQIYVTYDSMW
jgi:uncharacterized protein (DUF736 family)